MRHEQEGFMPEEGSLFSSRRGPPSWVSQCLVRVAFYSGALLTDLARKIRKRVHGNKLKRGDSP